MTKYDDNKNGHDDATAGFIKNRTCTDLLFAIFFVICLFAMLAAAVYGWAKGNPDMMLIGWDSDKNGCGYSEVTKDY
jgi:hypothetical protein